MVSPDTVMPLTFDYTVSMQEQILGTGRPTTYTGRLFFYVSGAKDLRVVDFAPSARVLDADEHQAWFGKGKELWRVTWSGSGTGAPEKVAEFEFEPFRLLEIPKQYEERILQIMKQKRDENKSSRYGASHPEHE